MRISLYSLERIKACLLQLITALYKKIPCYVEDESGNERTEVFWNKLYSRNLIMIRWHNAEITLFGAPVSSSCSFPLRRSRNRKHEIVFSSIVRHSSVLPVILSACSDACFMNSTRRELSQFLPAVLLRMAAKRLFWAAFCLRSGWDRSP